MVVAPLFMVTGAPGSGKTSVLPHLVAAGAGLFVVADMDEILTAGRLLGVPIAGAAGEPSWPAYNHLWVRITMLVRRSGQPMVLLCPLEPAEWLGGESDVVWTLLDCSNRERRRRLAERRWDRQSVAQAVADAASLRSAVLDRIVTDGLQLIETAHQIADRVAKEVNRQAPSVLSPQPGTAHSHRHPSSGHQ